MSISTRTTDGRRDATIPTAWTGVVAGSTTAARDARLEAKGSAQHLHRLPEKFYIM